MEVLGETEHGTVEVEVEGLVSARLPALLTATRAGSLVVQVEPEVLSANARVVVVVVVVVVLVFLFLET
jgi:hypothetical protein